MFLSSDKLKEAIQSGELAIIPFSDVHLKPASYAFTLDKILQDVATGEEITMPFEGYILEPGRFVTGKTVETVNLKNSYICILGTKGSTAQKGVDVVQSSIIAEPDTNNQFTLEIKNNGPKAIYLIPDMEIVKGIFSRIA